ncbi:uncharacterized protein LOC135399883 isoform X2 [Ornithodoros turicata]
MGVVALLGLVLLFHPGGSGHRIAIVQKDEERDAVELNTTSTTRSSSAETDTLLVLPNTNDNDRGRSITRKEEATLVLGRGSGTSLPDITSFTEESINTSATRIITASTSTTREDETRRTTETKRATSRSGALLTDTKSVPTIIVRSISSTTLFPTTGLATSTRATTASRGPITNLASTSTSRVPNTSTPRIAVPSIQIRRKPYPPLACVTGQGKMRAALPDDGVCDYTIFAHARFVGKSLNPVTSRKSFVEFLREAKKAKRSKFLISFKYEDLHRTIDFMTGSTAAAAVVKYAKEGIGGYGYSYIEMDLHAFTKAAYMLRDCFREIKEKFLHEGVHPVTFIGVAIRTYKNETRQDVLRLSYDILKYLDLYIMVSHTPATTSGQCFVEPISAWNSSALNDQSLQSMQDAADVIKQGQGADVTFFLSMSLGALQFRVPTDNSNDTASLKGVECSSSRMVPYYKVCSKPTHQVEGDVMLYHMEREHGIWRTYETENTILEKMTLAVQRIGFAEKHRLGWIAYDVNLEDFHGNCTSLQAGGQTQAWRRLLFIKDLLKKSP